MLKFPDISYRAVSEDICYDNFIANKSLIIFWNNFDIKAIEVCHTITIGIGRYPVCSY